MPYTPVTNSQVADVFLRDEVFRRADWLLHDVYCMFTLPSGSDGTAGGNWTIALALLCVVDGISRHVYPTRSLTPKQEQRFKRLINEKLQRGPINKGWYRKANAAAVLYTEFRNPLVHELAIDKPARARPSTYHESAVGKWGPVRIQDIKAIDALPAWNDDWPTLSVENYDGGKRLKLSCAALYWTVKNMVNTLAADIAILNAAAAARLRV
jgi:hypothetical protein